jgi:putative peptide zinc metalloprotease protein
VSTLEYCAAHSRPVRLAVGPGSTGEDLSGEPDRTAGLRPRGGVELVGKYEGSGRETERYLARRPDGAYVELTSLLYLVISTLDGRRTPGEVATVIGEKTGMDISAENVEYLLQKLHPLGLIEANPGQENEKTLDRPEMVLGLRIKKHVLPARSVRATTRVLQHLFHLPIVAVVVGAFVALVIDMVLTGHLSTSVTALINRPQLTLVLLGLVLVSMVFHELGHASACRYGGATPGEIGGGLYLMWPSLYTNVTDAYRLGRGGRVRTDLGGVYFNAVFCVVLGAIYQITGYAPLILAVATTAILMLEQLLPFVRFDGYWIVSDLAGVPDLFPRFGAALHSLVRGPGSHGRHTRNHREVGGPGIDDLRANPRRIIVLWAAVTAVVLPLELALTLFLSATLFVSFALGLASHYDSLQQYIAEGNIAGAAVDVIQGLLLVVLLVGLTYALCFVGYRICRYAVRRFGRGLWSRAAIAVFVLGVLVAPVVWSAMQVRLVHGTS